MAFKVLKQYIPTAATVWVEKLSDSDSVDVYDTESAAETKKSELTTADNSRQYKIVEV